MAIEFPLNPTDGQILSYGALRYKFFASKTYWKTSQINPTSPVVSFSTTTSLLGYFESSNVEISAYQGYVLTGITVNNQSWVTVYTGSAKRSADSSRLISTDPGPNSGVVAELIAYNAGFYSVTPSVYAINTDTPITDKIYLKVTNLKSIASTSTITLNLIQTGV